MGILQYCFPHHLKCLFEDFCKERINVSDIKGKACMHNRLFLPGCSSLKTRGCHTAGLYQVPPCPLHPTCTFQLNYWKEKVQRRSPVRSWHLETQSHYLRHWSAKSPNLCTGLLKRQKKKMTKIINTQENKPQLTTSH